MAKLTINSFEGDSFLIWFNDEERPSMKYFDVSDFSKLMSTESADTADEIAKSWKLSKTRIRFERFNVPTFNSNGDIVASNDIFVEWGGKFKIKGDRIIGGTVNRFSRDWTGSYGNIEITDIKFNLKKEMGQFMFLTLPNEISDHFDGPMVDAQYDSYGNIINTVYRYLGQLPAGSTYEFSTPYG